MGKLTYSDKLKSPKWQKKRLEIMKRDKFACKLCGDTETQLHVHHKEYINGNDPWDYWREDPDYKETEKILIKQYQPKFNSQWR